jgi:hypothetical protein
LGTHPSRRPAGERRRLRRHRSVGQI